MKTMKTNRRQFLGTCATATASLAAPQLLAAGDSTVHVATNVYPWMTFYSRAGRDLNKELDSALGEAAAAGLQGWEPIAEQPADCDRLAAQLQKHGLDMRSLYVNSTLHDPAQAKASFDRLLGIARRARELGTRFIVTNPSPIRWGGPEDKTDEQLKVQADALDRLGAALRGLGLQLAYHNHDIELRQGAREFHHMLTATAPENVRLCLDAHWIFRGCGNSEVAVFDVLAHYHPRIVELHLRQSREGIWTEAFSMEGDIDYGRLFAFLRSKSLKPHLVLEQAVEGGSPKTLTAAEAHRQGVKNLREGLSV